MVIEIATSGLERFKYPNNMWILNEEMEIIITPNNEIVSKEVSSVSYHLYKCNYASYGAPLKVIKYDCSLEEWKLLISEDITVRNMIKEIILNRHENKNYKW